MNETIFDLVKKAESNYKAGNLRQGRYVDFDLGETIAQIDAYANSTHISGRKDALGREKPFFNIVNAAVNVWFKTTDIDRKNIRFKATKAANYVKSFVATLLLRRWMDKENFGQFLNNWGRTLAKYGSAVVKFVEKDGKLIPTVVAWDRLICDPVNFEDNLKIEKLYYTPSQLRRLGYDEELVEEAIEAVSDTRENLYGEKKDVRDDYIGIYEVHGELPLSHLTDKESDEKVYRQQMHVIFISGGKGKNAKELTLYSGKESRDPYMITHLIEEDGRVLGKGAVELLFDAQWMVNHSAKQIKDQLELASKMVLQTADETYQGKNVLTNIETGDILLTDVNKPFTQVNNQSHDVPAITSFLQQWQGLAREITGTPESITGETMPSGTAYRQVAILNQEAHSLFQLMLENKGLYLEQMMRKFVIPFFKKKLNNADEVALILEGHELEQLDSLALPKQLEQEIKNRILTGQELPEMGQMEQEIRQRNMQTGNTRFLSTKKTWKSYFEDLEDDIEIEITGENSDKNTIITTLTTVLQSIAGNPMILQDPNAKMVFNKILEEAGGISPIQIKQTQTGISPAVGGVGIPEMTQPQ